MGKMTVLIPGERPEDASTTVVIDGDSAYVTLDVSALVAAGLITANNGIVRLRREEAGAIGAGLVAQSRRPSLSVVKP